MTDSKQLLDIEPGGENTPYESIRLFTETPPKQTGQLGGNLPHTISEMRTEPQPDDKAQSAEAEEAAWAKKLELGESTTGISGFADMDSSQTQKDAEKIRRQQGYGPGSGVGA